MRFVKREEIKKGKKGKLQEKEEGRERRKQRIKIRKRTLKKQGRKPIIKERKREG